jgi:uncharacterized protein (DUF885 family)
MLIPPSRRRAILLALMLTTTCLVPAGCGPNHKERAAIEAAETAAESKRLFDFFETKFDESVKRSPMFQTYLGRKDNYGEWDDVTEAHQLEDLEIQRANVREMKSTFIFDKLDAQGKLSWRLAEYKLSEAETAYAFRNHRYVFDQMNGAQAEVPAFLINQHKVDTVADAEAYISRLENMPAYLDGLIERSRTAAAAGITPPRFVYDFVISDTKNVMTGKPFGGTKDSPLLEDFRSKVAGLVSKSIIDKAAGDALVSRAEAALKTQVKPVYERILAEMLVQSKSASTDDGVWKLPDGGAYYAAQLERNTTTDMSAAEIHQLGLDEVARIQEEMKAIMVKTGFKGDLKAFFEFMRADARFYKPNTDAGRAEYLAEARAAIDRMKADLPKVFNTFPKADMIVKAVEPFREKSAGKAFYSQPSADGSKPGTYYANLYRMQDMPTYQLEALAFHEGIPGHHMQIAIAQELEGIPQFRKYGDYTAFSEGWGLYSELLPKEMGYYSDPYADFGRLAMEIWRAARLVVDTGLHDKRWTRQQAVQYLLDNTPNPEGDCRKAIDRYIVYPGQATAYKIGMLKIVELRERAKKELGTRFDIRDFHDVVLRDGAVPLAILEENVDAWIASRQAPSR